MRSALYSLVVPDTLIIAKVPTGAETCKIQVTTPGRTATSADNFTFD